jgi:signal transduction histidine kinase
MAAATFIPGPDDTPASHWRALPAQQLPEAVLFATLIILGAAVVAASVDRRRTARALLSRRLLAAQENERRRIARGLHDELGQTLTALRLNLQRLSPTTTEVPIIADSVSLVDDALTRVRALALELRPSVLDDLGLTAAVEWYAKRSSERAGYAISVVSTLGVERLPEPVETAAFRVLQQALVNTARHAKARHVRVELARASRELELTVIDDGVGFDVTTATANAEAGDSLGLLEMRETVTLANGTLSLTSQAGRGSIVRARFPLES